MMARLAGRLRMTEGQLYTTVIIILSALLLSLTGLPTAERTPSVQPGAPVFESPPTEDAP